jgi:uncharacterized membrane protein
MRPLYFFPLTALFVIAFFFLLVLLFVFLQVGLISYAYERIGIDANLIIPLLLLSLLGSAFNIPVTEVRSGPPMTKQVVDVFGMRYIIPLARFPQRTVIALNVGGAVVPTVISLYLLFTTGLIVRGLVGIALVSAVVYRFARPIPGIGIAVPLFVPPLLAALVGVLLAPAQAPALAYLLEP